MHVLCQRLAVVEFCCWGRQKRVPVCCGNGLELPEGCRGAADLSWEQQKHRSVMARPLARGEREQCDWTGLCSLPCNLKDEIIQKPRNVCQWTARLPFFCPCACPARQEQLTCYGLWLRSWWKANPSCSRNGKVELKSTTGWWTLTPSLGSGVAACASTLHQKPLSAPRFLRSFLFSSSSSSEFLCILVTFGQSG